MSNFDLNAIIDSERLDINPGFVTYAKSLDTEASLDGKYFQCSSNLSDFHAQIRGIISQAYIKYKIDYQDSYAVHIYPPRPAGQSVVSIPPTSYPVINRLVLVIGSKEDISLVDIQRGQTVNRYMTENASFLFRPLVSQSFSLSYNDERDIKYGNTKGCRPNSVRAKKTLHNRCVVIVDFMSTFEDYQKVAEEIMATRNVIGKKVRV